MSRCGRVTKADTDRGTKRVSLQLTIKDYDQLSLCAEYNGIPNAGTMAVSYLRKIIREESARIEKSGYVPRAMRGGDIFKQKGGKSK